MRQARDEGLKERHELRHRTRANDWLIDREVQRTKTYTGIQGVNTQDLAVQESMGPIEDRTREHLGTTDKAIIELRYLLLDSITDYKKGIEPRGLNPKTYRGIRSGDLVLPNGIKWQRSRKRTAGGKVVEPELLTPRLASLRCCSGHALRETLLFVRQADERIERFHDGNQDQRRLFPLRRLSRALSQ